MSTNLVVLFTFLVLFTGFFTSMSTFYYSTNDYEFSSAFYWVHHVDEYYLLFYECVFVVGHVYTIEPHVGSHKISMST